MKKGLKIFLISVSSLVLILIILFIVIYSLYRQSYPKTRGKLEISGLNDQVEIYRDEYGVPHIYAANSHDLFMAQGFVHAQDRFYQMEFWRRIGQGRLSEFFGESQLETDIFLRTAGFFRIAQREYELMDPETREYLDAYCEGVNAYILDRKPEKLGLEFMLLKLTGVEIKIEPWTGAHTIAWGKIMSLDLGGNLGVEMTNPDILRTAGLNGFLDLYAPYQDDMPFIVSDSGSGSAALNAFRLFSSGTTVGSNNWVISGELTSTGKPLLADDMHLGIQMPSIWYEIGLHGRSSDGKTGRTKNCPFDLRGYSFPGVPGIIVGHNDKIAWGVTNLGPDIQDLYQEKINPENTDQYLSNGEWKDMEIIYEEIRIHEEDDPSLLRIRNTRHGPVISDMEMYSRLNQTTIVPGQDFPGKADIRVVALRWTALEPGTLLQAVPRLDKAENYEEFREALKLWDCPGQNFVYADIDGNIAYQSTGKIPVRKYGSGLAPVPGWTDEYEWTGYIPFDEMPALFNPEKGYIVTANNPVVSSEYPYFINTEFSYGYRAKRISELIEADTDGITIEDIQKIHADVFSYAGLEFADYLKNLDITEGDKTLLEKEDDTEKLENALDWFTEWDGMLDRESSRAVLYGYFWIELFRMIFEDQYPENLMPDASQARFQNSVHYLLEDPGNKWWDDIRTPEIKETRDYILINAFIRGCREAEKTLGSNTGKWKWGDVHTAEFRNQTLGESGIKLIENIFNRGPFPVDGGNTQVNVSAWDAENPFEVYHIASMRQIIDMSDLKNSLMVHPTGQSGHAGNKHYDDFIKSWINTEYHPTFWELEDIKSSHHSLLKLVPQ